MSEDFSHVQICVMSVLLRNIQYSTVELLIMTEGKTDALSAVIRNVVQNVNMHDMNAAKEAVRLQALTNTVERLKSQIASK